MSATRVLFIDDLEKKRSQGRECHRDNQEEPYHSIRVHPVAEEDGRREYNHRDVDGNQGYEPGMSPEPGHPPGADRNTSLVCLLESEMIPEHGQKDSTEDGDGQGSGGEDGEPCFLQGDAHSITIDSDR